MNQLIQWSEKYVVGIQKIDDEHKQIVQLLNQLHASLSSGKNTEILNSTLNQLVEYTLWHFQNEEKLFDLPQYTESTVHKKEHANFVTEIQSFLQNNQIGAKLSASIRLTGFLREWLIKHILTVDKRYVSYMHQNGIK